jgi:hypothetical protein
MLVLTITISEPSGRVTKVGEAVLEISKAAKNVGRIKSRGIEFPSLVERG